MEETVGFDKALEELKQAPELLEAKRKNWSYSHAIRIVKGKYPIDAPAKNLIGGVHPKLFDFSDEKTNLRMPYFGLHVNGQLLKKKFLPDMEDMLAEDWIVRKFKK